MLSKQEKLRLLENARKELILLEEQEKEAVIAKAKRDTKIKQAKSVIEFLSEEDVMDKNESVSQDVPTYDPKELPVTMDSNFVYPIKGTWEDRIKAILKFSNRVLAISEMFEAFKPFETKLNDKQLLAIVSNTVTTMANTKGLLKKYDPPFKMRGFYYGNPIWWEGDVLKKEHEPKPKEAKLW